MERYIFIREYRKPLDEYDYILIPKGTLLIKDEGDHFVYGSIKGISGDIIETSIRNELSICLLQLDADLFKTAFQSFAYTNWMKEKVADIDEQGNPRYPNLTKTPETLIMYLMELGVAANTLIRYIYGPENKYLEYRYLVQEFGKML